MAWKSKSNSKISCLVIMFMFTLLYRPLLGQSSEGEAVISRFDREIMEKAGVLDSIRVELERGRKRLNELQQQEGNYLGRLQQLEQNIVASTIYLTLLANQIDTVTETINLLGDSLESAEADLDNNRTLMKKRLRQAYMRGEYNMLQILLTAKTPLEMINRARYLQELNKHDQRLAQTIWETIESVERKQVEQKKKKEQLSNLLVVRQAEQVEIVQEKDRRKEVLEQIRSEQSVYEVMVKELEAAQRELDGILSRLEVDRKRAREELERKAVVDFKSLKGKLPWPLRGDVIAPFGKITHPVYQTVTMNNGIDIAASRGEQVRCVAFGSVAYVGWMRGLGRLAIVEHQGGFITIYAHLSEIDVRQDEMVAEGTVIGRVGETGTADGSKLHFSIRQSAQSLDPMSWLSN